MLPAQPVVVLQWGSHNVSTSANVFTSSGASWRVGHEPLSDPLCNGILCIWHVLGQALKSRMQTQEVGSARFFLRNRYALIDPCGHRLGRDR